jgi:MFS family permease
MYGLGSVIGPLLGGAFTGNQNLTWRWCFYINLPLGAVTAVMLLLFMTSQKPAPLSVKEQLKQMDLLGTILFLPAVVALLVPLQWGGTRYPWSDARIIAPLVVSIVLFGAFIVSQLYTGDAATVPPRVFKNRNVWGSAVYGSFITAAFLAMMLYVSQSIPECHRETANPNNLHLDTYLVPGN